MEFLMHDYFFAYANVKKILCENLKESAPEIAAALERVPADESGKAETEEQKPLEQIARETRAICYALYAGFNMRIADLNRTKDCVSAHLINYVLETAEKNLTGALERLTERPITEAEFSAVRKAVYDIGLRVAKGKLFD
ncbi:MAG: hypothetical protein ACI4QC_09815 [Thermoguttaceae bacterium]